MTTAVTANAVASVVGIKPNFVDLRGGNVLNLEQRITVVGQGATAATYSTDKRTVTSAVEVGQTYGFGSPVHLAAQQLLPENGDGAQALPITINPLEDAGTGVAAAGSITPSGTQSGAGSYIVRVNNIDSAAFVIADGELGTDLEARITDAINANVDMPVIAAAGADVVDLTAKWAGPTGNDIYVEVIGPDNGITFAVVQPTGGLVNPNIDDALTAIGTVWETMLLNCLDVADTDTLDKYETWGVGRWQATTKKPAIVFTGNTATTVAAATAVSDARPDDYINGQLVAPGSKDLPFVVAARQLARIAVQATNNPPTSYQALQATGLTPGADADQWNDTDRNLAIKAGSSTIEVKDTVVELADIVTFYHPTGVPNPEYRYVVDIVKLQNIIYNLNLIFATPNWAGKPLIPDEQPTANANARQPKGAKAAVALLIDNLALAAVISDPAFAKSSIVAAISSTNPKRLDIAFTVKLSGNTNIISIDLNFGFYFGVVTPAA